MSDQEQRIIPRPPICKQLMMLDERGRYFVSQFNNYGENRYDNLSCDEVELREIVAWGELPAEDDPRWICYERWAPPPKGQVVLRVDYRKDSAYSPYFDKYLAPVAYPFPGFMGCPTHYDTGAKAWIPVERLDLPFKMPDVIRHMRRRVEIDLEELSRQKAAVTDAMFLTVTNDGPTYRRVFEPLCQQGRTAFFTKAGKPREAVVRATRQAIGRTYGGSRADGAYHSALCRATQAVFEYYVQHSDEISKVRPAQEQHYA
jgi:hypothetical protein